MKAASTPDPVDVHVGDRIRLRRKQIGQSQTALALKLGVSFQQVQKYERGANRISASMMHHASAAQGVAPSFYFEGLGEVERLGLGPDASAAMAWITSPEAWPLAQAVARLPDNLQRAVLKIAHDLAEAA
jgi:transcriptional regulator with XRE-family HTH domain